jgi:hypothetical protein
MACLSVCTYMFMFIHERECEREHDHEDEREYDHES